MQRSTFQNFADYIGISGAFLCLLHCLALPLLMMANAVLAQVFAQVSWLINDYTFAGLALVAVFFSAKQAHSVQIRQWMWGSALFFALMVLLADQHEVFEWASYAGSIGLISAHTANLRQCRRHAACVHAHRQAPVQEAAA